MARGIFCVPADEPADTETEPVEVVATPVAGPDEWLALVEVAITEADCAEAPANREQTIMIE